MSKRKICAEVDEKKIHGLGKKIRTIREYKGLIFPYLSHTTG